MRPKADMRKAFIDVISAYVHGTSSAEEYFQAFSALVNEYDEELGPEEFDEIVGRLWIALDAHDEEIPPEHDHYPSQLSGVTMMKWATAALRDLRRINAETEQQD
ncbi:MAG: hypothetical protein O7C98_16855 [Planctomycetota bacterium]|nr:hypothetical protein [Planctomycetota bacterium]